MADDSALLLERLNRKWKECDRIYHEVARRSGLSDCAFWIMYGLVCADGPLPQKNMSQAWQYSKQTVASALQQLERQGLIVVRLAEGSRRDKVIELTETGDAFCDRHVRPVLQSERQALQSMGTERADALIETMGHYLQLLSQVIDERRD